MFFSPVNLASKSLITMFLILLLKTKKELYEDYNFNIIAPSKWLFNEVSKSFLSKKHKNNLKGRVI